MTREELVGTIMDIDRRIRPLVTALNSLKGVTTIFSCQGHWFSASSPDFIVSMPWVNFYAPTDTAVGIARLLYDLDLNYDWRIKAHVVNQCPQGPHYVFWMIEPEKNWYFRKKMDDDIKDIANAVSLATPEVIYR